MSFSYPDVQCIPGTGSTLLGVITVGMPKAAYQYQSCQRFPSAAVQPTGNWEYNLLNTRYSSSLVITVSG